MLRMVFCDVDGTLLKAGESAIDGETLDTLRRLSDKGILIAVASGRPYSELRSLFSSLSRRLIFICLDGALTMHRDCVLHKRPLDRKEAITFLSRYSDFRVFGRETVYRFGNPVGGGTNTEYLKGIGEPFLKLELPTETFSENAYWYRVAYQRNGVTELVAPCADKGNAARTVMQKFAVSPDQAVAFGDSENDLPLFAAVGHPFRMQSGTVCDPAIPAVSSVKDKLKELFL